MILALIKMLKSLIFGGCNHTWGRWEDWAVTYQKRYCIKCGKSKKRDHS